MLRFMRNRRKSSGKKKSSGEVASPPDLASAEAPSTGDEVILTGVRTTDSNGYGATGYPEPPPATQSDVSGESNGAEASSIPDEGSMMAAIPEEAAAHAEVDIEREVAGELQYAFPDGESVEDQESVVTVIEKKGRDEDEEDEQPTYATVNKPAQRLRARGEQLNDCYILDKGAHVNGIDPATVEPTARVEIEGTPGGDEEDEGGEHQQARDPREEDFYIYVSEDALQKQRPRTSPISVEPASLTTFDSPERQDSVRERGERGRRPEEVSNGRHAEEDPHQQQPMRYIRQLSAPAHPGAEDPENGTEYDPRYDPRAEGIMYDHRKDQEDPRQQKGYDDRPADWSEQERGSDREFPGHPYHEYDSDRSDYENYRSYDRRRPAYKDDPRMIIRRSPSGGFIERTHSMPTIRHERRPMHHSYPHRRPRHYRHPHERRHRSRRPHHHPEHDPYRYPDRHGRYPEPYTNGYGPHKGPPSKGYPVGHPNREPHQGPHPHSYHSTERRQPNSEQRSPMPNQRHIGKPIPNGDAFHQTPNRESPEHSAASSESGERRRDQRVSFKEAGTEVNTRRYPEIVEEGTPDDSKKALLSAGGKQDDDAVSLGSQASEMSSDERRPKRLLLRRSIAIWFAWFCMGFFTEVVGPNIPYLRGRVNGTHDDVGVALGARGGGLLLGSAVGGLLCEVAPNFIDLWISSSLILGALCTSAVPWSMNLVHLCLTLGLSGFSKGFLQVATVTLTFSLWARRGAIYVIFFIHMAYAVGAAPCAQLAFLFDAGVLEQLLLGTNSTSSSVNVDQAGIAEAPRSDAVTGEPDELLGGLLDTIPRPMYPFDMAAVLTFVCGAVFLGFFGSSIRSVSPASAARSSSVKTRDAGEQSGSGRWFMPGTCGPRAVLSLIVYFLLPMGVLAVVGSYHHLYLTAGGAPLSKSQALLLQTVFWGAVAVGRLITPALARCCLSPNGLTISCLTMSILSTALMGVYGEKYPVFVWIFTLFLGVFTGPILPAGLTLCSVCVSPTAMGVAVAFMCQAVGDGVFSWAAGFLLGNFRPEYLLYMALGSAGASFVLYLPIIPVLARKKSELHSNKKKGKAIG